MSWQHGPLFGDQHRVGENTAAMIWYVYFFSEAGTALMSNIEPNMGDVFADSRLQPYHLDFVGAQSNEATAVATYQ
jgi:hypothetical protein